jgi:uncharacterized lipoprotein YddW (UPF0748 family)
MSWRTSTPCLSGDWRRWLDTGVIDVACPMAYTPDDAIFERQIGSAVRAAATGAVWAGIGAYRLRPTRQSTRSHRPAASAPTGSSSFSYDSLARMPGSSTLSSIGRAVFLP